MKNLKKISILIMLLGLILIIFACKPEELNTGSKGENLVVYDDIDDFIESLYDDVSSIPFRKDLVKSSIVNFRMDTAQTRSGEDVTVTPLENNTCKVVITGENPATAIIKLSDVYLDEGFVMKADIEDAIFFKETENSENLRMTRTTGVNNDVAEFERIYEIDINENSTIVTWEDVNNSVDISGIFTVKPPVHPDNDLLVFDLTLVSDDQDNDDPDDDTVHLRDDETGETTGEVDMSSGDGTEDDPWTVVDEDGNVVGYVWGNECGWWFEDAESGWIDGITGGDNGWHDAQGLDDFKGNKIENGLLTEEFLLFCRLNGISPNEVGESGQILEDFSIFIFLAFPGLTLGAIIAALFNE